MVFYFVFAAALKTVAASYSMNGPVFLAHTVHTVLYRLFLSFDDDVQLLSSVVVASDL